MATAKAEVEKKIQCEFCIASFPHENILKEHIDLEHAVKLPHECKKCDASFSQRPDLKRHITSLHG